MRCAVILVYHEGLLEKRTCTGEAGKVKRVERAEGALLDERWQKQTINLL